MYEAYDGVCAYTGMRMHRVLSDPTIDHFVPKSKRPDLAYEWTNYRLALAKVDSAFFK